MTLDGESPVVQRLQRFWAVLTLEGLVCLLYLLLIPSEFQGGVRFGHYSRERWLLIIAMLLVNALLAVMLISARRGYPLARWPLGLAERGERSPVLSYIVLGMFTTALVLGVLLLLFWLFTSDQHYQGLLSRVGPFLFLVVVGTAHFIAGFFEWISAKIKPIWTRSTLVAAAFVGGQWFLIAEIHRRYSIGLLLALLVLCAFSAFMLTSLEAGHPAKARRSWLVGLPVLLALLLLQAPFIPQSYWSPRDITIRFLPALGLAALIIVRFTAWVAGALQGRKWTKWLYLIAMVALLVSLGSAYRSAANEHAERINVDYTGDQRSLMGFAEEVRTSGFTDTGDRNQMPAFAYVQALFVDPENDLDTLFATGKQVNILLSLVLLGLLLAVFRFFFPLQRAMLLTLVVAFASYIFRSGYFTVEILYYFLFFLSYLLLGGMLYRPSILLALATGLVLGLTHLTKAAVFPAIAIYLLVFIGKALANLLAERSKGSPPRDWLGQVPGLISTLVLFGVFMATIFSYGIESKREYGKFFYNINYFVIWYDNWEQAELDRAQYGFHDIPEDQIPSLGKFIASHSMEDVVDRIQYGLAWQWENFRYQFGVFHYPVFFMGLTLALGALNFRAALALIKRDPFLVAFALLFHLGYLALFIWYSPIASLSRFIYSLFIPFVFSLFFAAQSLSGERDRLVLGLGELAVAAMLVFDIPYVLSTGLFRGTFGS